MKQLSPLLLPLLASNQLWGYVRADGSWAVEAHFEAASHFSEGLALVRKGEHLGYINLKGELKIGFELCDSLGFWSGLAPAAIVTAEQTIKWGLIDYCGSFQLAPVYDFIGPVFNELARFCQRGRWGYTNALGQTIVEPRFDWTGDFVDGIARVQVIRKTLETFYIDTEGRTLGTQHFENGEDFCNGLAAIFQGGAWGFIDRRGELLIAPQFAAVGEFSEGVIPISVDGRRWIYINTRAEQVVPGSFDEAHAFVDGYARVCQGGKWGMINSKGDWLLLPQFDELADFCEGWALFQKQGQIGYIDPQGSIIVGAAIRVSASAG